MILLRRFRVGIRLGAILGLCLWVAAAAAAPPFTWTNPAGGSFHVGSNWTPVGPPGAGQTAQFNTFYNPFTVYLSTTVSNSALLQDRGDVTLDLGGQTYTLAGLFVSNSSDEAALPGM